MTRIFLSAVITVLMHGIVFGGEDTIPHVRTAADALAARDACAAACGLPVTFTNGVGMVMVLIPAAEFTMGNGGDPVAPAHRVRITRPFYIATTETTQWQYRDVVGKRPAWHAEEGRDSRPVESVTFFDSLHFCAALSAQEKRRYRLPSEAEWELAAGAGVVTDEYARQEAWHLGNSEDRTHRVGTRPAGLFGLFDMTGNVWEWTLDVVCAYDRDVVSVDPLNARWEWKTRRKSRIIRGGCYNVPPAMCVPWRRVYVFEQFTSAPFIGFRAIMEVPSNDATE